jgi:hypothetical protein
MNDIVKMIPCYVKFVVSLVVQLVAAAFVIAVLGSLFFPDINPVDHLVTLINSFMGEKSGGFTGLLALVVFVYFVSLFKSDCCKSGSCDSKRCDSD